RRLRAQGLERPARVVSPRSGLVEPSGPLVGLAARSGERPLELVGCGLLPALGLDGLEPALEPGSRRLRFLEPPAKLGQLPFELRDPRLARRDVRLGLRESRPLLLELRLELGERHASCKVLEELFDAGVAAVRLRLGLRLRWQRGRSA